MLNTKLLPQKSMHAIGTYSSDFKPYLACIISSSILYKILKTKLIK